MAVVPRGISVRGMKCMVLVPLVGLSVSPWHSRPISSVMAFPHKGPSLLLLSSVYSALLPVSGLIAVPTAFFLVQIEAFGGGNGFSGYGSMVNSTR